MFNKKDITPVILKFCRERYGVYCYLSKNTTFKELKFDKFDMLYMVLACEEYFGIHIAQDEMGALLDIKALNSLVINKLNAIGMLSTEKVVPQNSEKEAAEAVEDAKSNDGVPAVKTEGDFEREEIEAEATQKEAEEQNLPTNTEETEQLPETTTDIPVETETVPAEQQTPIVAETQTEEVQGA